MERNNIIRYNQLNTKNPSNFLLISLLAFYVLSNSVPITGIYISTEVYLAAVICIYIMSFLGGENLYNSFNNTAMFTLPLLLYVLFEFIFNMQYRVDSIPMFFWKYGLIIIPPILAYYLLCNEKRSLIKKIVFVAIIGFVITAVTSFIGLLTYPDAARWLATVASSKDDRLIFLQKQNIGGYEIVYSIVILFPMIVCLYKQRVINLALTIIITGAFTCYLIQAQYAMALMMFFLSFILFFISKNLSVKKLIISLIFLLLAYFLFSGTMANLFQWLANIVNSKTLADRFAYISSLIRGVADTNNELSMRPKLYELSIQSFLQKPIFGWWATKRYANGGHSFFLDFLANFGILGGISMFVVIRHLFKKLYHPFRGTYIYAYMLWSFLLYMFVATFNTATSFLFITFFIVPLIGFQLQSDTFKTLRSRGIKL